MLHHATTPRPGHRWASPPETNWQRFVRAYGTASEYEQLTPVSRRSGDDDRFLLYAAKELEPVCKQQYSIVYFAAASPAGPRALGFVRRVCAHSVGLPSGLGSFVW
jgi:hypothetical protein